MGTPRFKSVYVVRVAGEVGHVYEFGPHASKVFFDSEFDETLDWAWAENDEIDVVEEIVILEEE